MTQNSFLYRYRIIYSRNLTSIYKCTGEKDSITANGIRDGLCPKYKTSILSILGPTMHMDDSTNVSHFTTSFFNKRQYHIVCDSNLLLGKSSMALKTCFDVNNNNLNVFQRKNIYSSILYQLNLRYYATKPSNLHFNSEFIPLTQDKSTRTSVQIDTLSTDSKKQAARKNNMSKSIKLNRLLKHKEKILRMQIAALSSQPLAKQMISKLKHDDKMNGSENIMGIQSKRKSSGIKENALTGREFEIQNLDERDEESQLASNSNHQENAYRDLFTKKIKRQSWTESTDNNNGELGQYRSVKYDNRRTTNNNMKARDFNMKNMKEDLSDHRTKRDQISIHLNRNGRTKKDERSPLDDDFDSPSNRKIFAKLKLTDDWIRYVLQFGPTKYIQKSGFNINFRNFLPFRADIISENGTRTDLFPEDHPLYEKFTSNLDVFYNSKSGVRNNKKYIALSVKAKEKLYYSMQNVSPLLLHVFIKVPMKLVAEATEPKDIPMEKQNQDESKVLPNECIVCGRSNVGKSSLINALVRRPVMLTSPKPGKTQSLNFYRLGQVLTLVDLPGYGFAYDVEESLVQKWNNTIEWYIKNRGDKLKMVYLIVDCRHGLKVNDLAMIRNLIEVNAPFSIVFSKTDLEYPDIIAKRLYLSCIKIVEVMRGLKEEQKYSKEIPSLEEIRDKFFFCSSVSLSGIGKLRASMEPFMNLKKVARRFNEETHPKPKFLKLRSEV